ncbi:ribonuclease HII [Sphaerisporangium siamense]|uniref:Ribonuclease HII n=1 Tax=Sphaerisporangium siamense TaxID=795645 RepID=A0A7W7D245_9ACTN|nr:ribonuclease HII [Sphaerisporangium siamense]MBB4698731.1 ribonuclease HII [Sphaerisporangium siamense]GII85209.1 ribonuclease HII [Sphaerisporangium siamense]
MPTPRAPEDPSPATLPGLEATEGPRRAAPRREAGYEIERELRAAGSTVIAGVDEVGRGAWAGPVVVCAAVTDLSAPPEPPGRGGRPVRLTDSKLLTRAHREAFAEALPGWLSCHAFGEAGAEEIDEVGMTEALRRAAERALASLPRRPDVVILDGAHDFLRGAWRVRCEVKADQRSVTVAAASVLAKVRRDRLMEAVGAGHPAYGFAENAGYPSPAHQRALAESGPTPHHRLSWSYLDDLPAWRHLRKHRDPLAPSGQMTLL